MSIWDLLRNINHGELSSDAQPFIDKKNTNVITAQKNFTKAVHDYRTLIRGKIYPGKQQHFTCVEGKSAELYNKLPEIYNLNEFNTILETEYEKIGGKKAIIIKPENIGEEFKKIYKIDCDKQNKPTVEVPPSSPTSSNSNSLNSARSNPLQTPKPRLSMQLHSPNSVSPGQQQQRGLNAGIVTPKSLPSPTANRHRMALGIATDTGQSAENIENKLSRERSAQQTGLESPKQQQTGLKSPIQQQTGLKSPTQQQTGLKSPTQPEGRTAPTLGTRGQWVGESQNPVSAGVGPRSRQRAGKNLKTITRKRQR